MKKLLPTLFFALLSIGIFAQNPIPNGCGSDQLWNIQAQNDPLFQEIQAGFDRQISDFISSQGMNRTTGITATYTIPVVVHIIHNGGTENISDATVQQGIQDLNDAFANRGDYDSLVGVNTDIEFCLASQDPNGVGTTGIVRVQSPLTTFFLETQDVSLKALSNWDPTRYLNIWLVREINSISMGSGVAGYATFPSSHGAPTDGIVNEARWFGSTTSNSKIHVHEAGHYLGLYHTFQGGCANNDCMNQGDRVCDTPPDGSNAAVPCGASPNTCSTDADDLSANNPFRPVSSGGLGDQPDMFNNYMDYGYQGCQNAFTLGQKTRMTAAISGARSSLLASLGCLSPCTNPIVANFTASGTNVAAGTLVTFTSTGTGGTTFEWTRDGVSFGTGQNASWLTNAGGVFTITLNVTNGDPSCAQSYSVDVTVTCSEHADFTSSSTTTSLGGTVSFTNTSTGGSTNFEWLVDGVVQGTNTQFSYTFPTAGGYLVQLVQIGTACSDTSLGHYISVGDCRPNFANRWYFGYGAGIEFGSGQPVALLDCVLSFNAAEAQASACDSAGTLMFYTNGVNVYTRNHTVMVGGSAIRGGNSSAQGAMAMKKPGSSTNYYLFTQCNFAGAVGPDDGFYVSEIDMSLQGGLGEVISHTDTLQRVAAEYMMAVNHCNGRDVWVLNHSFGSDEFNAFLVTPTGIQAPVVTNIGFGVSGGFNNTGCIGQMKCSPDGKRIAMTGTYHNPRIEMFDFDNSTGVLSNPHVIVSPNFESPYSVEFSPNGKILYVDNHGDRNQKPANVWQFDMTQPTYAAIEASMTKISTDHASLGTMQLGPDGKLYIGRFEAAIAEFYLARIENPNTLGSACDFQYDGFYLGTNQGHYGSSIGLPLFNSSYFAPIAPIVSGPDTVCANSQGVVYSLGKSACSGAGNYTYAVAGNGQVISSTDSTVTLSFGGPGNVILTVIETAACGEGSVDIHIHVIPSGPTTYLGPDVLLCQGASTTFDAGAGFATYLWNTGATTQTIQASTAGIYWCEVTGGSDCRPRDSVIVTMNTAPLTVNLGPDQTVCAGQIANLDAGPGYASYVWQDGSTNQVYSAFFAGNYSVTVTGGQCVGTATDQVDVIHSQAFNVNLGPDTVMCVPSTIVLNPGASSGTYVWQDGSTGPTFSVTQPGTYWVQVSNAQGCGSADTIEITNCVGVTDFYAGLEAEIWPNPTSDDVNIRITMAQIPRTVRISLWDIWGRELKVDAPRRVGHQLDASFDLSEFAAGIYFVRFQTEKGTKTWKVERR